MGSSRDDEPTRPVPAAVSLEQTVYHAIVELNMLARGSGLSKEEMMVRCMDLMLSLQDSLDREGQG